MATRELPRKPEMSQPESGLLAGATGNQNDTDLKGLRFNGWLVATCLIFPVLLSCWFAFDNSWPFWDAADHVRVEFQYADLLRHARPWNIHWIKDFLTVNYCYPATVHIFNGALKALLGNARWVDSLSLIVFSVVLSFSTCATALLLLRNRVAAALSVGFINIYPCVALLSHIKLLDFPHLSMYCTAMLSVVWWQQKPNWSRAILCGTALGLACTTKQIAPFFLFAPCFAILLQQLRTTRWDRALQLTSAGLMVLLFLAVWVIPNAAEINGYMHRNAGELGSRTILTAFMPNLLGYVNCASGLTGYPLLWLALLSLCLASRKQLRDLFLPAISAITGILCMSALPFQLPEHRYIANALLFPALLCSAQLCRWFREKNRIMISLSGALALLGLVQFVAQNFAPYPIPISRPVIRTLLGTNTDRRGPLEPSFNPTPPGDLWGQQWVVRECKRASNNQVCWLNMLPSTPELSVHTVALISRYEGSNVRPTTTRLWTPTGDRIDFDHNSWRNFHFYLLKTGSQGLQFDSKKSAINYKQIEEQVSHGDAYRLIAGRTIEDGSTLSLYGRIDFVGNVPVTNTQTDTATSTTAIVPSKTLNQAALVKSDVGQRR